jgi:hypothetical protein
MDLRCLEELDTAVVGKGKHLHEDALGDTSVGMMYYAFKNSLVFTFTSITLNLDC